MIPEEKKAAVTRALSEAFGVTECEDIRTITKGRTSALVFRIEVGGCPYLLRIGMYKNDRQFVCMKASAEAGLAPRVWYVNIEDQIFIADFVAETSLPADEALVRMPDLLRALHALPPFPAAVRHFDTSCMFLINAGPAVEGLIQKFKEANVMSESESEQLLAWYAQIAAIYPAGYEPDMVSSHNDLFKPDNILFDRERVWLVDWEAAFLNDRYADLAVVANMLVKNDEEERLYLHRYFRQAPDAYQLARFFLARQISHIFYTMVFLMQGPAGRPLGPSDETPEYDAFQRRFWGGEIQLVDSETKAMYGRVHWDALVRDARQARFGEALRIVAERHGCEAALS